MHAAQVPTCDDAKLQAWERKAARPQEMKNRAAPRKGMPPFLHPKPRETWGGCDSFCWRSQFWDWWLVVVPQL